MLNLTSTLSFIVAKTLALKSAALAVLTPYIDALLANILLVITGIISAVALLCVTAIVTIQIIKFIYFVMKHIKINVSTSSHPTKSKTEECISLDATTEPEHTTKTPSDLMVNSNKPGVGKEKKEPTVVIGETITNREVMRAALKETVAMLAFASKDIKEDKEFILDAMRGRDGAALIFASEKLRADKDFIMKAISQMKGNTFIFASSNLKKDLEVTLAACLRAGSSYALDHTSDEIRDKIVSENWLRLGHPEYNNDRRLFEDAIQKCGFMIAFASPEIRSDRELMLIAARNSGHVLYFADNNIRNDEEIVRAALSNNDDVISCASPELQIKLYRQYPKALSGITGNLFSGVTLNTITPSQILLCESMLAKVFFKQHGLYLKARSFLRFLQKKINMDCTIEILKFILPPDIPEAEIARLKDDKVNSEIFCARKKVSALQLGGIPSSQLDKTLLASEHVAQMTPLP